jgi:hypothetical protein
LLCQEGPDSIERGMVGISKPIVPDRSKIALESEDGIKHWTKHFGVTKEELLWAIERVGNSAATVRKELDAKAHGSKAR